LGNESEESQRRRVAVRKHRACRLLSCRCVYVSVIQKQHARRNALPSQLGFRPSRRFLPGYRSRWLPHYGVATAWALVPRCLRCRGLGLLGELLAGNAVPVAVAGSVLPVDLGVYGGSPLSIGHCPLGRLAALGDAVGESLEQCVAVGVLPAGRPGSGGSGTRQDYGGEDGAAEYDVAHSQMVRGSPAAGGMDGEGGAPVKVFVTQTGTKYHARVDLTCMEKAQGWEEVDLQVAADQGLRPCVTCDAPSLPDMSEGDARWLRTIDDWQRKSLFESRWEAAFARRVLARVPGLSADDVQVQEYLATGSDSYKADFLIPKARLVLEVDGFAKDGQPMSATDLERRNRRDAALQAAGFAVRHFSNSQVSQEPQACIEIVKSALQAASPAPQPAAPARPSAAPPDAEPSEGLEAASVGAKADAGSGGGVSRWIILAAVLVAAIAAVVIIVATRTSSPGGQVAGTSTGSTLGQPEAAPGTVATWASPISISDCPITHPLKGNIKPDSMIVHAPGDRYYEETEPERCYASQADAEADGFRRAKQ